MAGLLDNVSVAISLMKEALDLLDYPEVEHIAAMLTHAIEVAQSVEAPRNPSAINAAWLE